MDRLDKLMAQCRQDVAEIASSESEITSTSNRLLYELASARQTNMTQSVQESVKRNTEAMLNILVTYTTTVDHPSNLSTAPFRSALPAHPSQPDNCRLPTGNDEDGQLVHHDSVSNLVK